MNMSMDEQLRLELIALVEQRIGVLKSQTEKEKSDTATEDDSSAAGQVDAARLDTESISKKIASEHKAELAQLYINRQWLDTDQAGFCEKCECGIPIARLKAVLNTRLCIDCAETSSRQASGM